MKTLTSLSHRGGVLLQGRASFFLLVAVLRLRLVFVPLIEPLGGPSQLLISKREMLGNNSGFGVKKSKHLGFGNIWAKTYFKGHT